MVAQSWEGGEAGKGTIGCKIQLNGRKDWVAVVAVLIQVKIPESVCVVVSEFGSANTLSAYPILEVIKAEIGSKPCLGLSLLLTLAEQVLDTPETVDWTSVPAYRLPDRKRNQTTAFTPPAQTPAAPASAASSSKPKAPQQCQAKHPGNGKPCGFTCASLTGEPLAHTHQNTHTRARTHTHTHTHT